jgi:hypothetical protein
MLDVRLDCDFQWYRNGAALTGETDWQHGVHTMERGTVLQARSVCRIPGYLPVTSWSRKLTIAGVPALVSFLGNDALRDVAILEQPRFQQLWLVRASSAGRYPAGSMQGFNNFDMSGLTSLGLGGDLDDDGREDLVGRDRSGVLWAYTAGDRRFKLGSGWNGMDLIVTGGDVTKDRVADVYARRRSDGALLFYPGRARLGLASGRVVTTGLRTAVRIVTIGDANGDGIADLHATFPNGDLYFYPGRIDGGLGARVRVGTGWSGMTALLAGRDLNQDGKADLLGRDAKGNLWLYAGNGRGGLTSRVLTNSGNPLPAKVY